MKCFYQICYFTIFISGQGAQKESIISGTIKIDFCHFSGPEKQRDIMIQSIRFHNTTILRFTKSYILHINWE